MNVLPFSHCRTCIKMRSVVNDIYECSRCRKERLDATPGQTFRSFVNLLLALGLCVLIRLDV